MAETANGLLRLVEQDRESELDFSFVAAGQNSPQKRTGRAVLVPDYVAISVLILVVVWALADWLPRGKL